MRQSLETGTKDNLNTEDHVCQVVEDRRSLGAAHLECMLFLLLTPVSSTFWHWWYDLGKTELCYQRNKFSSAL